MPSGNCCGSSCRLAGGCGRRRDYRQMIDWIPPRVRTGAQWRDLPGLFGPRMTFHDRHRLRSADGARALAVCDGAPSTAPAPTYAQVHAFIDGALRHVPLSLSRSGA
ncbi:transposase [Streptomyces sp. st77]|uniref:transposase n=1 Tax=Streptomyces sp. st77 TaxID=1828074 RepID=UPI00359CB025